MNKSLKSAHSKKHKATPMYITYIGNRYQAIEEPGSHMVLHKGYEPWDMNPNEAGTTIELLNTMHEGLDFLNKRNGFKVSLIHVEQTR